MNRISKFFITAVVALAVTAPAHAAPATPTPLAPADGAVVDAFPAFAWSPVAGAAQYEFQLAADSGFNSPVLGYGEDRFFTGNTRATVKKTAPNGTYWWRVRASAADGTPSPWSAPRLLQKRWDATPTLESPAQGAVLTYPSEPLLFKWTPVPRAAKYLFALATDPNLGSLVWNEPVETAGNVLSHTRPLAPGTYYWGVTPVDAQGNRGTPSRVASFTHSWLTVTSTRLTDLVAAPEVVDPQFSWDPVPGAARYEVEINPSIFFAAGSKVCCTGTTLGTFYSPTVHYRNNTYYWRVRAIDAAGNAGVWNEGPSFMKTFDTVPTVDAPSIKNMRMRDNLTDPGTDLDAAAPGFQTESPVVVWDPVPGASSYEVEVAEYSFEFARCDWVNGRAFRTATPAWTPLGVRPSGTPFGEWPAGISNDRLWETGPSANYCLRVRARTDRDNNRQEIYGDYTTLNHGGSGFAFTFTGFPDGGPCSPSCNAGYLGSGDYLLPAYGTLTPRMPLFTWKAISGSQSYFVIVARDAEFTTIVDYVHTNVPAYAPRKTFTQIPTYADETTLYYWVVLPSPTLDGSFAVGEPSQGAPSNFHKQSVAPTLLGPANGAVLGGPPTFRWTPAEAARRYRLQVSQDPTFGDPIDNVTTNSTAYTSNSTYPADTILYWRVRADDENLVGLTWSQTGTFQKRLATPVQSADNPTSGDLIPAWRWAPVPGAVSYDVAVDEPDGDRRVWTNVPTAVFTFAKMTGTGVWTWRVRANFPEAPSGATPGPFSGAKLFTRTIHEPAGATTDAAPGRLLLSWQPRLGAKEYRVQISSRPDFGAIVENVATQNTDYAPRLTTGQAYLRGGTFYWRVAAMDEDMNLGDFTQARDFTLPAAATQTVTLAKRIRIAAVGRPVVKRRVAIRIITRSQLSRPLAGVRVRVWGAGIEPQVKRTNRYGRVTFWVRATRRATVTFNATKLGYPRATLRLLAR